jgi:hypothetical protein
MPAISRSVRLAAFALAVAALGVLAVWLPIAPAGARPTHKASFDGVLVASGESGSRVVVTSVIVFRGEFKGVGEIVEVDNRPGDPENVLRDDLVFAKGAMHLRSVTGSVVSSSLDPKTCVFEGTLNQTGKVQGGTGKFRHASGSFAGTVRVRSVAMRNADGTCSQEQLPLLEVDILAAHGTLSIRQ